MNTAVFWQQKLPGPLIRSIKSVKFQQSIAVFTFFCDIHTCLMHSLFHHILICCGSPDTLNMLSASLQTHILELSPAAYWE